MHNKKIAIIITITFLFFPSNIFAKSMENEYTMQTSSNGNSLYYYGEWTNTTTSDAAYMTTDECLKSGGTPELNTSPMRWWYTYKTTCSVKSDVIKNRSLTCQVSSSTGSGKNESESQKACMNKLSCTVEQKRTTKPYELGTKDISFTTASGEKMVDKSGYGIWSINNPNANIYASYSTLKYKCSKTTTTVNKGIKTLIQTSHKTSSGLDAYCVNPGLAFSSGHKYVKENIDEATTKQIAAIIEKGKNSGNSFNVIQLALRFLFASKGLDSGSGYWDPNSNNIYTAQSGLYKNTINAGVQKCSKEATYLCYNDVASQNDLTAALDLFKSAGSTPSNSKFIYKVGVYYDSSSSTGYQKMIVYDPDADEPGIDPNPDKPVPDVCTNTEIKNNVPISCSDSSDSVEGALEDPLMCAILNSKQSIKSQYKTEYADGNDYCDVYCTEKYNFRFMGKEEVLAGRYFQYDVSSKGYLKTKYLSTVIEITRNCASVVDYKKWEDAYKKANSAVLNAWNDFKFYEVTYNHKEEYTDQLITKSCGSCGCCGERDQEGKCPDGGCSNNCSVTYTYRTWSSGKYHKTDPKTGNESSEIGFITNDGSATCSADCCSGLCSTSKKDPAYDSIESNYSSYKSKYEQSLKYRRDLIAKLHDCNLEDNFTISEPSPVGSKTYNDNIYDDLFRFNPDTQIRVDYQETYAISDPLENEKGDIKKIDIKYNAMPDQNLNSDKEKWKSYCSNCENDLSSLGTSTSYGIDKWVCSGQETSAECHFEKENVPKNNFAYATLETEIGYYQGVQFSTQLFTGKVKPGHDIGNGWLNIEDEHIYPVSLNKKTGEYDVEVFYSEIGSDNSKQRFQKVLQENNNKYYCKYIVNNQTTIFDCSESGKYDPDARCLIDIDSSSTGGNNKAGLGLYFRTIDLNKIFNTTVPGNWSNSTKIISDIETLGDDIWIDKEPFYSITLSPATIKEIKKYNKEKEDNDGYLDNSLECEGYNCTSDFFTKSGIFNTNNYSSVFTGKSNSLPQGNRYLYQKNN